MTQATNKATSAVSLTSSHSAGVQGAQRKQGTLAVADELFQAQQFERSKASSKQYRTGFKYGVYLPFKRATVGLNEKEEAKFELYEKHTKFTDGIKKVSEAYTTYRRATEAVPESSSLKELQEARAIELETATALVDSYNDVIAVAGDHTGYRRDLHMELKKSGELIFRTVNEAFAKVEMSKNKDQAIAYQTFMLNIAKHVHDAVDKTGAFDVVGEVAEGFKAGLASFPELAKEGMGVIEMHAHFVALGDSSEPAADATNLEKAEAGKVQIQREKMKEQITSHFNAELQKLVDGDKPITRRDLEKIQYQGISLLSVRNISFDELEMMQDLQRTNQSLRESAKRIPELQAVLDETQEYQFEEISGFFDIPAQVSYESLRDPNVFRSPGLREYRSTREKLDKIQNTLSAKEAKADQEVQMRESDLQQRLTSFAANSREIAELELEEHVLIDEMKATGKKLEEYHAEYKQAEAEHNAEVEKKKRQFKHGFRDYDSECAKASALHKQTVDAFGQEKKAQTDQLDKLQARLAVCRAEVNTQSDAIPRVRQEISNIRKAMAQTRATQEQAMTKMLQNSIALKGEDVRYLGEQLRFQGSIDPKSSRMLSTFFTATDAYLEKQALEAQNKELTPRADHLRDGLVSIASSKVDQMQVAIQTKLYENIELAKEANIRTIGAFGQIFKQRRERIAGEQSNPFDTMAVAQESAFERDARGLVRHQASDFLDRIRRRLAEAEIILVEIPKEAPKPAKVSPGGEMKLLSDDKDVGSSFSEILLPSEKDDDLGQPPFVRLESSVSAGQPAVDLKHLYEVDSL